jgi:hypothetical protein
MKRVQIVRSRFGSDSTYMFYSRLIILLAVRDMMRVDVFIIYEVSVREGSK